MNYDWLMKHTDNSGHIICSVWKIDGIYFDDVARIFGQPNIIREKKGLWENEDEWLFELFTGDKVKMYFDISDYINNKMLKLNLKSHGPLKQTEIPVLTIMCGHEIWPLINLLFSFIFHKDINDKQIAKAFNYIFEDK